MSTYIDHKGMSGMPGVQGGFELVTLHSWADHTARNLTWHYGERAERIIDGRDPKTQADIARWNTLGRRSAA